ncbi:MAG: flagellar hook capping FlgD N-terminal domain-containing protein [bacterium]
MIYEITKEHAMLAYEIANLLNLQNIQTPARTPSNELDKQDFLELLIKQMANQDPLDPMENSEFVSQLAQFGALEQSINLNESFENFMSFQQLTQASLLLGKKVICLVPTDDGLAAASGTVNQVMTINGTAYLCLSDGSEVELSTVVSVENPANTDDSRGDSA